MEDEKKKGLSDLAKGMLIGAGVAFVCMLPIIILQAKWIREDSFKLAGYK